MTLCLISCTDLCVENASVAEKGCLTLSVDSECSVTRSPGSRAGGNIDTPAYESAVNTVQLMIFNSEGLLEHYYSSKTAVSNVSFECRVGMKTVVAAANAPSLAEIADLSSCRARLIDLREHSRTEEEGFVLAGSASCEVKSGMNKTLPVNVSRMLARVSLAKLTNALPSAHASISIESISLINVVGRQNLFCDASAEFWYNKGAVEEDAPDFVTESVALDLENGKSYSHDNYFYCYPNPLKTEFGAAGKTRLVVEALIGNVRYYYPVTIDNAMRNVAYSVELTIVGPGSTDPDIPVDKSDMPFEIKVLPWADEIVYTEKI